MTGLALLAAVVSIALAAVPARADLGKVGTEFEVTDDSGFPYQEIKRTQSVSRAPDGTFVVVWAQLGGFGGIFGRRYDSDGTPLGTQFQASEEAGSTLRSRTPAVVHDSDSSFVVVWVGFPEPNEQPRRSVLGRRFDSEGEPVGTMFRVSEITASYDDQPDVEPIGGGNFVVVWESYEPQGGYQYQYNIFGQRVDTDGGKVGTEFQINTYTTQYNRDPQVGSRGDGSFVVVWENGGEAYAGLDGNSFGVVARRFGTDGAPLGTEFVVNTFTTYSEDDPDIAVHSDGSFVVVWKTQYGDDGVFPDPDTDSITMRRYGTNGLPLGDEVHLNSYTSGAQGEPSVAMDDDGSFVVVWESGYSYLSPDDREGDGIGLFGLCFTPQGVQDGPEFQINSYTTNDQVEASIATDGAGNFVVVWSNEEFEDAGHTRAQRFERGGGVVGPTEVPTDKSDGDHLWGEDAIVPYEIEVTNDFGITADFVITDTVPRKSTFVDVASTSGWQCDGDGSAGSTCTFTIEDLPADASETVTFAVEADEELDPLWRLYNRARVTSPDINESGGSDEVTEYGLCESLNFDSVICSFICFIVPTACSQAQSFLAGGRGAVPFPRFATLRMRDEVLLETRGGERLVNLYYEQSSNAVMAAMSNPGIVMLAVTAATNWAANVMPLIEGEGDEAFITQDQVDSAVALFDALEAAGNDELTRVIQRERARVDLPGSVGMSLTEGIAALEGLSCQGPEGGILCGEVSGDCLVTATDALTVLQMALDLVDEVDEADVDGSGVVNTTDALITLFIAVKLQASANGCNTVF